MRSLAFQPVNLSLLNYRAYLLSFAFIAGNLIFPQICHLVPDGGKMLLPIYFFTLIASYKFGIRIGLITALLSPLCNHLLFGMPPIGALPVLLIKSSLLAIAAAWIAQRSKKVSLLLIAVTVIAYQFIGSIAEYVISGSLPMAIQDITLGFPGMIIQIVFGWLILKSLAKYEC
nr:ECF transporter S component [uncultured Bacteroides sp.]